MSIKMVSQLYGRHQDDDIYVVGTGAGLRVFPKDFFANKVTIGLNMAWKSLPVKYAITIHPDLNVPEFINGEQPQPDITWVVGNKKTQKVLRSSPEKLRYAEENFYFFNYHGRPNTQPDNQPSDAGRIVDWVRRPTEDNIYVWSSISQAGANLAANLGAKNVILVGCDNCALLNNHHASQQHTRWKAVSPDLRYRQYYEGLVEVRQALRERGVNLLSMSSLLKMDDPELDFTELCRELSLPRYLESHDISDPKFRPSLSSRLRQWWESRSQ